MKDSFNADFYATAATVIPVLYIALAVQGSTLEDIAKWASRRIYGKPGESSKVRVQLSVMGASFLAGAIFGSAWAEVTALNALYNQKADAADAQFVLFALTIWIVTIGVVSLAKPAKILRDADLASRSEATAKSSPPSRLAWLAELLVLLVCIVLLLVVFVQIASLPTISFVRAFLAIILIVEIRTFAKDLVQNRPGKRKS
jgi:hypothetical protein